MDVPSTLENLSKDSGGYAKPQGNVAKDRSVGLRVPWLTFGVESPLVNRF